MRTLTSAARRPKNSWFLFPTKIGDGYQIDIGYKSGTGKIGFYSTSPQSSPVKIPWGPPVSCEFVARRKPGADDISREFKFSNARSIQPIAFDECILNLIECGVNAFTQKLVSLRVKGHKKLLGNYITLVQHSESFVHHRDKHDSLGFMLDGTGLREIHLEENGGSLAEYKEFIQLVKDNARETIGKGDEAIQASMKADRRKKKATSDRENDSAKKSRSSIVNENEKNELEDDAGIEKKFQSCYIGFTNIPLENLEVAKELRSTVNQYRVYRFMADFRVKYDPSQAIIVVCPEDDTRPPDLQQVGQQKFLVVQKIHTFLAFQELSKKGEFRSLTGHSAGTVVCYVLNTNSSALIHYGNLRGNEIANKYTRRTYPQDLLHVFESLVRNESRVSALKVVERMSKLSRIGPDESTSIRKLCQWSENGFRVLMEVIDKFEDYETCDLRSACGNVGSIARCEKQKMTNDTFNKLAKCAENYFVFESDQVLAGAISIKSVAEEFQISVEVDKVYAVLSQISGYVSKDQLIKEYPGKFEKNVLVKYVGAEIKNCRKNDQASLLYDYWEKTTTEMAHEYQDPVRFEEIHNLKEMAEKVDVVEKFDFIILNLKNAQQEMCMTVMNMIMRSTKVFVAALLIFPTENLQFECLTCLRNMFLGDTTKIWPIYFNNQRQKNDGQLCENMDFGIIFGKFNVLVPCLKRAYNHLGNVSEIVEKICPPLCTIGMVVDHGMQMIKVHSSKLEHRVIYLGSQADLARFKMELFKVKGKSKPELVPGSVETDPIKEKSSVVHSSSGGGKSSKPLCENRIIKGETSSKSLENKLKGKSLKHSPSLKSAGSSHKTPKVKRADISQETPKVIGGVSHARRRIDPGTSSSSKTGVEQIVKVKRNDFEFDGSSTSPHKAYKSVKDVCSSGIDSTRRIDKMLKIIKESE